MKTMNMGERQRRAGRGVAWAVAVGLLLGPAAAVRAQSVEPRIAVTLEPPSITVGDPIAATVVVDHGAGSRVAWPETFEVMPFELLAARTGEPAVEGERARSRAELTVTAFELGELTFPAVAVEVVGADGAVVSLTSDAVPVTVASVGRDEGGDIREIKAPLAIPVGLIALLPWLAAGLGLAAIVYAWRRWRRHRRPDAPAPMVPPRPAHEIAYEALEALDRAGLLERGEIKTFHIRASDIIRSYVEGRFGIDALEMTTGALLAGLRHVDVSSGVVGDVRGLLEHCDLVKFAKLEPPFSRCREVVPLARRVIDNTRPRQPPPVAAASEAHVA